MVYNVITRSRRSDELSMGEKVTIVVMISTLIAVMFMRGIIGATREDVNIIYEENSASYQKTEKLIKNK